MGNSVSSDSRRGYARPGEIALPILEVKPPEPPPAVAPVPNRLSPTPPAAKDTVNRINTVNPINRTNAVNTTKATNTVNTVNPINRTNTVSTKRVSARFELLPDRKPQWNRIG